MYDRYNSRIENVQKRFLKYLTYKCDQVYPQRGCDYNILLDRFNFTSIESRRKVHSIMFLAKLLQNNIDCPALLENINIHVPRVASRQQLYFECPRARTNMQTRSPIYNMFNNTNLFINDIDIFTVSMISIMNLIKYKNENTCQCSTSLQPLNRPFGHHQRPVSPASNHRRVLLLLELISVV